MDRKELEKLLREFGAKQGSEKHKQLEQIKTLQLLEQLSKQADSEEDVLVRARQAADRFIEDFERWTIEARKQLKPKG